MHSLCCRSCRQVGSSRRVQQSTVAWCRRSISRCPLPRSFSWLHLCRTSSCCLSRHLCNAFYVPLGDARLSVDRRREAVSAYVHHSYDHSKLPGPSQLWDQQCFIPILRLRSNTSAFAIHTRHSYYCICMYFLQLSTAFVTHTLATFPSAVCASCETCINHRFCACSWSNFLIIGTA